MHSGTLAATTPCILNISRVKHLFKSWSDSDDQPGQDFIKRNLKELIKKSGERLAAPGKWYTVIVSYIKYDSLNTNAEIIALIIYRCRIMLGHSESSAAPAQLHRTLNKEATECLSNQQDLTQQVKVSAWAVSKTTGVAPSRKTCTHLDWGSQQTHWLSHSVSQNHKKGGNESFLCHIAFTSQSRQGVP